MGHSSVGEGTGHTADVQQALVASPPHWDSWVRGALTPSPIPVSLSCGPHPTEDTPPVFRCRQKAGQSCSPGPYLEPSALRRPSIQVEADSPRPPPLGLPAGGLPASISPSWISTPAKSSPGAWPWPSQHPSPAPADAAPRCRRHACPPSPRGPGRGGWPTTPAKWPPQVRSQPPRSGPQSWPSNLQLPSRAERPGIRARLPPAEPL